MEVSAAMSDLSNDHGPAPVPPRRAGSNPTVTDGDLDPVRLANQRALHDACMASIDTLLASVAALTVVTNLANPTMNQNAAASIKDVAREVKTVARCTARLARLMCASFDSTDVGDAL
jgi:hypothetical protein